MAKPAPSELNLDSSTNIVLRKAVASGLRQALVPEMPLPEKLQGLLEELRRREKAEQSS